MVYSCPWNRSTLLTTGVYIRVHKEHPVVHLLQNKKHSNTLGSLETNQASPDGFYEIDFPTFNRCLDILYKFRRFQ